MNKYFFFLFLLVSCAATQPVTTPPVTVIKYVYDTVTVTKLVTDTVYKTLTDTLYKTDTVSTTVVIPLEEDTNKNILYIYPVPNTDNYPQLQAAIYYNIANPGSRVILGAGHFSYSEPLIIASVVNGVFKQVTYNIAGQGGKDKPDAFCTTLNPSFTNAPGVALQQGKGGQWKGIVVDGLFHLPDYLNITQVDTMRAVQWDDGICRQNIASPYCGIAIDPFSDSVYYSGSDSVYPSLRKYYITGMSRSGSTACYFEDIAIRHFVVDFIISPSNQQNGEIINLYRCQLEAARVAYAMCQAQSKQCELKDLMCWSPVQTLVDNTSYGIRHGDGGNAPMIDGVNAAGAVHQLFNIVSTSFQIDFRNVYGESIFKEGVIAASAGGHCDNFSIDYQNNTAGYPSPDFYQYEVGVTHSNCMYRLYPGTVPGQRITLSGFSNVFIGGSFNLAPVQERGNSSPFNNIFINVQEYYGSNVNLINRTNYDSIAWGGNTKVYVNKGSWTGYIISQTAVPAGLQTGSPVLTTSYPPQDQFGSFGSSCIVGYLSRVGGDTLYLQNIGWGVDTTRNLQLFYYLRQEVL